MRLPALITLLLGMVPALGVAEPSAQATAWRELNFDDTSAFSHKGTLDITRTAAIQTLCKIRPLVAHAEGLINLGRTVVGNSVVDFGMRHTFFGHFCGEVHI